jgi:tRNA1(Val) A37 N6-methylase TrmN6
MVPVSPRLSSSLSLRIKELKEKIKEERLKDEQVILTEAEIKETREAEGSGSIELICSEVTDLVCLHLKQYGCFMPEKNQTVTDAIAEILSGLKTRKNESLYSSRTRGGSAYLKSRFASFWEANNGPALRAFDRQTLFKIIQYRVGLNTKSETFDISLSEIRKGFVVGRYTVSFFKATTAAEIIARWMPDVPIKKMWDPSCGFGARLLGFASVCPDGVYIGTEPAKKTFADLEQVAEELKEALSNFRVELHNTGSEKEFVLPEVNLVFTSPPYFDQEQYFNEPGQCWLDHPRKSDWVSNYLIPTFKKSYRCLAKDGKMVININERNKQDVVYAAESVGFSLLAEEGLLLPADSFLRKNGVSEDRTEPVLIFGKESCVWKEVAGTNGRYEASDTGEIRSFTRQGGGKKLFNTVMSSGYLSVGLTAKEGERAQTFLVHRIIAQTFLGDPPSDQHTDVRHLDGNKKNNNVKNLAWGTRSENMRDVIVHREQQAKKTKEAKEEAKAEEKAERKRIWYEGRTGDTELVRVCIGLHRDNKLTIADIAKILDCSVSVASNILHGDNKILPDEQRVPVRSKRTETRKAEIKRLVKQGKSRAEVNTILKENLTAQDFYYYKEAIQKESNT